MSTSKIVIRIVSISFSILVIVLIVFGLFRLGDYSYDFGYRVFTEKPVDKDHARDSIVKIESGMSTIDIAELLEDKGLINSSTLFCVQLKLSAYNGKIIPGVYTLNTSQTARDMMKVMSTEEDSTEKQKE